MDKRSFKNKELLPWLVLRDLLTFQWLRSLWMGQKTVEEAAPAFRADQKLAGILFRACRATRKKFPRMSKKIDKLENRLHARLDCESRQEVVVLLQGVINDLHEIFEFSGLSHTKRIELHKALRRRLRPFNTLIKRAYGIRVTRMCGKCVYLHAKLVEGEIRWGLSERRRGFVCSDSLAVGASASTRSNSMSTSALTGH